MALRIAGFLVAIALLTGCAGNRVQTDYNPATDFGAYQRYLWLEETSGGDQALGSLMPQRVREALQRQLDQGLYRRAEPGQTPDFWVRYYVGEMAHTEESRSRASIGMGRASGNFGLGVGMSFPLGGSRVVREVQVVIDLLDGQSRALTWRGTRHFQLGDEDPKAVSTRIEATVQEIWAHFPPK